MGLLTNSNSSYKTIFSCFFFLFLEASRILVYFSVSLRLVIDTGLPYSAEEGRSVLSRFV